MKTVLLTRSLEVGGAERQLVLLAKSLHQRGRPVQVLSFYGKGDLAAELETAGIPWRSLDKEGTWDNWRFLMRLVRALRAEDASVVYSFLSSPNLFALLAKLFMPRLRVVWGVRASRRDLSRRAWQTRLSWRLECLSARYVDAIIVNSQAGLSFAVESGFPSARSHVVFNGVDTTRFRLLPEARGAVREAWNFRDAERVVGLVARLDPVKDHATFLRAAALMLAKEPLCRFVVVGDGPEAYKRELMELADALGLERAVVWAGTRLDMPEVYNGLDALCLSSVSEGFPNVVAEAMACGVPCAVTDVGDAAEVVGNLGMVVLPGDPSSMAQALLQVLSIEAGSTAALRTRVIEQFSVDALLDKTENILWSKV